MSYYPESDSHIRDNMKVVLVIKQPRKNQNMLQTLIHLIQLLKKFTALIAEVDKLDINKLTNVRTSLNNLKTKVDNFDIGKLKNVSLDLKQLSDVVDNKVAKIQSSTH